MSFGSNVDLDLLDDRCGLGLDLVDLLEALQITDDGFLGVLQGFLFCLALSNASLEGRNSDDKAALFSRG